MKNRKPDLVVNAYLQSDGATRYGFVRSPDDAVANAAMLRASGFPTPYRIRIYLKEPS